MSVDPKEQALQDALLARFPWAWASAYLVGRDPEPTMTLIFCNNQQITEVVAFQPGKRGWVISLLPDGAGGNAMWPQHGHVVRRSFR